VFIFLPSPAKNKTSFLCVLCAFAVRLSLTLHAFFNLHKAGIATEGACRRAGIL